MSEKLNMDETLIPPSPNWFQVSGMAVSKDGWIVYGGPSKSLCLLQPIPADHDGVIRGPTYNAHVFNRVNVEKIVSVDLSPEWPAKRTILTGSADGSVKQWCVDQLLQTNKAKPLLSHEVHSQEKEEIAGVGYSNDVYAVTVGCYGNIVKWDMYSNIVKTYSQVKSFKPLCMSCSPHLPLQVAIGTKQGVVFVLDLHGNGKIIYKVRGQDDEIINISWCPQFEVSLKKTLKDSEKRDTTKKQDKKTDKGKEKLKEKLNASGLDKNLPEDSFDASTSEDIVVPEDDMFDIYKDHEDNEFGHKKFQPEEICVKIQADTKEVDYLTECLKLKEEILKRKTEGESSIQTLVDALDNTHVDSKEAESSSSVPKLSSSGTTDKKCDGESSVHIHKHLIATIGKCGGVRIWSKSGKIVASCAVPTNVVKNQKAKLPYWPTVLWYKPDVLLIADGKSQLLECNPLKIDCKNKLDWTVVHTLHKRGLYCIVSNAPRVQTGTENKDDWMVYTASQDRNIIEYSLEKKKKVAVHATSGGFIYTILACPYDAGKIAVSVGDGAIRVWETGTCEDDDMKLDAGLVTSYWQNVQGKVLVIAWHPTKENLLAFATAESRIGLLDISGKNEKPAKVLPSSLSGPIYSICWGEGDNLYACANGDMVVYSANKPDEPATPIPVEVEGRAWAVSAVRWGARGAACGGGAGAVLVLAPAPPHAVLAAAMVFNKLIHTVEWHPQQTSSSNEESPYKNLLAVCSCERHGNIAILEYIDKEDGKQLQSYKMLTGHKMAVLQLAWNPHKDGQLLSTSQDFSVRIWDAIAGTCTGIFGGHAGSSLGAAWLPYPQLGSRVASGGGDCALRVWDSAACPPDSYSGNKFDALTKKERRKNKRELKAKKEEEEKKIMPNLEAADGIAIKTVAKPVQKGPKKFLLPNLQRPLNKESLLHAARIMFQKHLNKTSKDKELKEKISSDIDSMEKVFTERKQEKDSDSSQDEDGDDDEENLYDFDYLKMFGSIKEVNEILDKQMEDHQMARHVEAWIMLAVFRGHIDEMIKFASQRDLLCPFLVHMAPSVSYKYWKDATQLYVAQMDRVMAKGDEKKCEDHRAYGGLAYRKVATLLAVHDVRAAVHALAAARLYPEAYVLCRIRYMDSIAVETLKLWASERMTCGLYIDAAICYIVLGDLPEAATLLGKMNDQKCLDLAADIAKAAGRNMLLEHISEKRENMKNDAQTSETTEDDLEQLPSRIELLMKEEKVNGESSQPKVEVVNGDVTKNSS